MNVPYRVMEANIPIIKEGNDVTEVFSDVSHMNENLPSGLLSIGSLVAVPKPAFAYDLEIYGSDFKSMKAHIIKHLLRLKANTSEITSFVVFVDEEFPCDLVDTVMLELGIRRNHWRTEVAKRIMFETMIGPKSRY